MFRCVSSVVTAPPSPPSSWRSWRRPSAGHTTRTSSPERSWPSRSGSQRPEYRYNTAVYLSICQSIFKCLYLLISHSGQNTVTTQAIHLFIYTIHLSVYPSIYTSIYLIYLSIQLFMYEYEHISYIFIHLSTGDFMKKVPTATCALRDRWIVSIERVYTPTSFYMESAVSTYISIYLQPVSRIDFAHISLSIYSTLYIHMYFYKFIYLYKHIE